MKGLLSPPLQRRDLAFPAPGHIFLEGHVEEEAGGALDTEDDLATSANRDPAEVFPPRVASTRASDEEPLVRNPEHHGRIVGPVVGAESTRVGLHRENDAALDHVVERSIFTRGCER